MVTGATVFSACAQLFGKTAIRLVYGKLGTLLLEADPGKYS